MLTIDPMAWTPWWSINIRYSTFNVHANAPTINIPYSTLLYRSSKNTGLQNRRVSMHMRSYLPTRDVRFSIKHLTGVIGNYILSILLAYLSGAIPVGSPALIRVQCFLGRQCRAYRAQLLSSIQPARKHGNFELFKSSFSFKGTSKDDLQLCCLGCVRCSQRGEAFNINRAAMLCFRTTLHT